MMNVNLTPCEQSRRPAQPDFAVSFLRTAFRLLLEERHAWAWIGAAALLQASLTLVSPWVASRALDTALPNSAHHLLRALAVLGVFCATQAAWAGWIQERATVILQAQLEVRCVCKVLARYLAAPYQVLQRTEFGSTSETLAAGSLLVTGLVRVAVELVMSCATGILTLVMLACWDPTLALIAVALATFLALLMLLNGVTEAKAGARVLQRSSRAQELMQVLLRAVPTLRASGATERLTRHWSKEVRGQVLEGLSQGQARLTREVLQQGGQGAITWLATAWLVQRMFSEGLSVGQLVTSTLLVGSFLRAAMGLAQTGAGLVALRPHLARVDQMFELSSPTSTHRPAASLALDDCITLDGVWYRYSEGTRWILEAKTQSFPAGARTIVSAPSGSGKSTLLRLIAGLVSPTRGRLSVLGHDPRTASGLVGYLPQQSSLFEASIATNLTTLSGEPLSRALQVGALTGLDVVLATLPMGVETLISAGGGNLSAGQRQLVLLTAVFATHYPVLLLDEPTSQLDHEAQARVRWSELCETRTVICVQHDLGAGGTGSA
jgi:ABC-type bacteriocin/lantibiotic exporter with double-glycine peptidase domain